MHDAGFVERHVKQLGSHTANCVTPFTVTRVLPIGLRGTKQFVGELQEAQ